MEVSGIKIKKGFLIKAAELPIQANQEELDSFHEVVYVQEQSVAICLPQRLIDMDLGWFSQSWCNKRKRYWWCYEHTVSEIKGYFSNGS